MDSYDLYDPYGDDQSERGDMDFLEVELVRSKFRVLRKAVQLYIFHVKCMLLKFFFHI